jgi:hypothetical protein
LFCAILFASFTCYAQNKENLTPTEYVFNLTQTNKLDELRIIAPGFNEVYNDVAWEITLENNLLSFKRKIDGLTHQWNIDDLVFLRIDPKNNKVNIEVNLSR